jgi:hypothetical protein
MTIRKVFRRMDIHVNTGNLASIRAAVIDKIASFRMYPEGSLYYYYARVSAEWRVVIRYYSYSNGYSKVVRVVDWRY